ncbi:MAG: hypothetical protein AAGF85_03995 [Bacteroidota bacterium]
MTFIPGVGLIIKLASNLMNALSNELAVLINENNPALENMVERKIRQQERLINPCQLVLKLQDAMRAVHS